MRNNKSKATFQTFLSYLIPSMLGMALMAVYTFTDTFVVGQKLGSVALGAMGICTPIITITYALGFLFGMGGGALYSIEMGKKNIKKANGIFSTSLVMLLMLGVVLAILGNLFAEPFARFLGADDTNIAYVMPYLRCVVTYIPGFMYDVFIMSYIKNDGHPNVAMAAVVSGTGLNIVLDLLFVFAFGWGMFGAAIATCIGSFAGLAINTGYAVIKKLNIVLHTKNILRSEMFRIVKTGVSVFILECSNGIVIFVFINRAVLLYGTIGSSVYTIIMNWTLICFNLIMGIAQSVQPLISVSYGAGDRKKVQTYRGPRQVGKSTVLRHLYEDRRYITFDDPVLLAETRLEPGLFFRNNRPPIVLDEVQYISERFPYIRWNVTGVMRRDVFFLRVRSSIT